MSLDKWKILGLFPSEEDLTHLAAIADSDEESTEETIYSASTWDDNCRESSNPDQNYLQLRNKRGRKKGTSYGR